jgi:hypothetical protein
MISLALLCALLYYVIKSHLERPFEFTLFVTMRLQLELAYRQWWLHMKRGEPYLILELFEPSYLFIKFYFTNAGAPAHRVCIKVIAIMKEFSIILSHKAQLIKRVPQR